MVTTLRQRCPWDRRQSLSSTRPLLLNEVYELDEALRRRDWGAVQEELGDYFFLGLFLSKLLEEKKGIKLERVLAGVIEKLKARHPHVYGNLKVQDAEEVLANWERIKRANGKRSIFEGIPRALPGLRQAQLIQERCRRVGFDWQNARDVLKKVEEELRELKAELGPGRRRPRIQEELGDLIFALVNLCRHLGVDAEGALKDANDKFVRRFRRVERELERKGQKLGAVSAAELDRIWERTKGR